jgi:hypothetical protein
MDRNSAAEATGEILCLFDPVAAAADWRRGDRSYRVHSRIEATLAFARQENQRCFLCQVLPKPIGVMGIISSSDAFEAPGAPARIFALCDACANAKDRDQRIFKTLKVNAVAVPEPSS